MRLYRQHEASDVHETPNIHEGDGVILRRSIFREESRLPIRMEVWELEPGVSEGDHTHEGDGELEEIYYFLSGEGVMTVEGDEIPVAAGDCILAPPGVDHGFRNTGDALLKLVIIWGRPAA